MSETQQWKVDSCPDPNGFATIRPVDPWAPDCPHGDTSVDPIATVYNDDHARLIAKAPQLLKALSDLLPVATCNDDDIPAVGSTARAMIENARAAIKAVIGNGHA